MNGIYSRNTSIVATEIQIPGNKLKFIWGFPEKFLFLELSAIIILELIFILLKGS